MSKVSLKYILNALFSKSDNDIEKKIDENVAYNAPFYSDASIYEANDDIDSDINAIILEKLDTTHAEIEENTICDTDKNELPNESVAHEEIDIQVDFKKHVVPNTSSGDSLLDNHKCMKMIECCLNNLSLIDEIDETTPISAVKEIIRQNYIETLITIGATPIVDEYNFNAARHTPETAGFIKPNSPIEIITPGIEIDGKTLIKAIVKQQ